MVKQISNRTTLHNLNTVLAKCTHRNYKDLCEGRRTEVCNCYMIIASLNVQHADYTTSLLLFAVIGTLFFRFVMLKISYLQPLVWAFCMSYELLLFRSNIVVQLLRHCWLYHHYRDIVFSQPHNYSAVHKAQ
jgi:hypothetical protein